MYNEERIIKEQIKDQELAHRIFKQFMEIFIAPEISRRQENSELDNPLELRAAQIIFFPDGRKPQIRINSEVKAVATVRLRKAATKKKGDPIPGNEVEKLEEIKLAEKDDPDCGHATLIRIEDKWIITFDFQYNKGLSRKHIETAKKFYESAEFSFRKKNWIPLVDNLFSAAEPAAKATLLPLPDP